MRIKRKLACVLLSFVFAFSLMSVIQPGEAVNADEFITPVAKNNIDWIYYLNNNSLFSTESGYSRVVFNGSDLFVEDYNDSFEIQSRREIPVELPYFADFYNGENEYYLVFYDYNTDCDDSKETIRVVKYSKDWSRISSVSFLGKVTGENGWCYIRHPFSWGGCSIAELNGKLYLAAGREGYVDPSVGMGHQGLIVLEIDEATMSGRYVDGDLWHSFSQHFAVHDDWLLLLEESEGSECTQISKITPDSPYRYPIVNVLNYGGQRTSAWAVATRASAEGIACSDNNVLAVGTSIDQSKYDDPDANNIYYVYLTVTPLSVFDDHENYHKDRTDTGDFRWLSDSSSTGGMKGVKIVEINSNRFLVMWENSENEGTATNTEPLANHVLHYVFIDGDGNKISNEMKSNVPLSDCDPVVKDGWVSWCATSDCFAEFVSINTITGSVWKKDYRIAGEHSTWELKDGLLTISGTGKIKDDFIYDFLDKSEIRAVQIHDGITEIGNNAFARIGASTIVLPESVTIIGNYAFANSTTLRNIYIPDSVTEIGSDAFNTGWYWTGSGKTVYYVTIHCNEGSYASEYADELEITYTTEGGGYYYAPYHPGVTGVWKDGKWYNGAGIQIYDGIMEWKREGSSWYIEDSNGYIPKSKWEIVDGKRYYFDENGIMASNEWRDGQWLSRSGVQEYPNKGTWKSNDTGWWFEDESGWYPKSEWQKINGKWYYFDSDGYIETSCYRDGCWLDDEGAWNTKYGHGTWKNNDQGWWFTDNGWYPVSQWLWINGKRYYFNEEGYMESGCYRDGCWITKSGAWNPDYSNGTWKSDSTGRWYTDNGWYPRNCSLLIDGELYNFDSNGYVIENQDEGVTDTTSDSETVLPD